MKQLQPRTILALGLPCSLLVNLIVGISVYPLIEPELPGWQISVAVLAGAVWALIGIPVFVGMAFIRNRIGRPSKKHQKIRTAVNCCGLSLVLAVLGFGGAYFFKEQMVFEFPFCAFLSSIVGIVSALLVAITCLNILIRLHTDRRHTDFQTNN